MGDNYKTLRFPYTPTNPSGGVTVQVGVKDASKECQTVVPPGVLIFGRRYNNGPQEEKTGRGINRVAVGHTRTPAGFNVGENMVPIGVSMDGIVDPFNVKGNLDSNGRYSIAVGGSVTLCACIVDNDDLKMPDVLDTLYVDPYTSLPVQHRMDFCGKDYLMPFFSKTMPNGDNDFVKIGVVTWVNDNFQNDGIAEVRVHLDIEK